MFFGITFDKFDIDICTHQTDCLFFKVLRFVCNSLFLFVDYCFCLLRCADSPHFAEGIHIKRQVIYFSVIVSNRAVDVIVKFSKLVDIIPYFFIAGMEDMSAVFMNVDAVLLFAVNIAADMVSSIYYKALFATIFCFVGKYTAE